MRSARLILLVAAAVLSLAITALASAQRPGPVEDGTLSVRDGRATIQLRIKGGLIGRFARGKLTVTDSLSDSATVIVRGADRTRDVNERTTVYSGTNIRFRIADDRKFVVRINASKINFSAVGRGDGWLDGWGDPEEGVYFDGSFSRNGEQYRSIPDERERFELEALPTGG
ncbi:MAG TPA: hypothetical protein VGW30_02685 [Gaiellaceae bacterium]|nr:hypothetical protein [Gaiellaceae bacterium]